MPQKKLLQLIFLTFYYDSNFYHFISFILPVKHFSCPVVTKIKNGTKNNLINFH